MINEMQRRDAMNVMAWIRTGVAEVQGPIAP